MPWENTEEVATRHLEDLNEPTPVDHLYSALGNFWRSNLLQRSTKKAGQRGGFSAPKPAICDCGELANGRRLYGGLVRWEAGRARSIIHFGALI